MNIIWLNRASVQEPLEYRSFAGPWGEMLGIWHGEGLCRLAFVDSGEKREQLLSDAGAYWQRPISTMDGHDNRFRRLESQVQNWPQRPDSGVPVLEVIGTGFQHSVWRLLLQSAPGQKLGYGAMAQRLGCHGGARAVGQAVAANPIALLIPCHRVLPASGGVGQYRWGAHRKEDILATEQETVMV
ncbi:MAG: methylated-DNA--[protein]-cysteine S-methyltransferase [Oleiphilaceae bacterium]|nr:methylated-DNA--[protein]-cysteine S-methyltransferase [Oleiphilaceae bacterium]